MVIVASRADEASVNIRRNLLDLAPWEKLGEFRGHPALAHKERLLVTMDAHHLYEDDLDTEIRGALSVTPEVVIFASKHKSESGQRSFTVHPIGNWLKAEFGGRPGQLVPSAPGLMTAALRLLRAKTKGLGYTVSFEATHHGPYLSTPSIYIEVGSDLTAWQDNSAGRGIAETIMALHPEPDPIAVGIGGGHYVPRITDVALGRRVSFGHILPSYAAGAVGEPMLRQAIEKTPGASLVYFHRKAMEKPLLRTLETWFSARGLGVVHEEDLEALPREAKESTSISIQARS